MNDQADQEADQNRALIEQRTPQPPRPKPQLVAGGIPKALVPVDFEGAWRIANTVHLAGMAPRSLNSAEKCMVAILHGLEVGLTPMNALQSIAVINGRPQIWGDGAVGLIRASGLLEYLEEYYEHEDEPNMKAVCVVKRKGEPKPVKTDFSMADAKKANLLGKEGPWQTYPKRMLKMRARWALRDTFADVLKGLGLAEEAEDLARSQAEPERADDAPTERRRVPSPPAEQIADQSDPVKEVDDVLPMGGILAGVMAARKAEVISSGNGKPASDFPGDKPMPDIPENLRRKQPLKDSEEKWLISIRDAFAQVETIEELESERESLVFPAQETVSDTAWKTAEMLFQTNSERISG